MLFNSKKQLLSAANVKEAEDADCRFIKADVLSRQSHKTK